MSLTHKYPLSGKQLGKEVKAWGQQNHMAPNSKFCHLVSMKLKRRKGTGIKKTVRKNSRKKCFSSFFDLAATTYLNYKEQTASSIHEEYLVLPKLG